MAHITRIVFLYCVLVSSSVASEILKSWAEPLDVLPKLVTSAASAEAPFRPQEIQVDGATMRYYLSSVYYVGSCVAPFGTVHVACFEFRRLHLHSKPYIEFGPSTELLAFFDSSFRLRAYWDVSLVTDSKSFQLSGTLLSCAKTFVFDFERIPKDNQVVFRGKTYKMPLWQ